MKTKTQDGCALHKMFSGKRPEVGDQVELFLTVLTILGALGKLAKMTSFTKKSYLRGVLLLKPWGCHTVIISCLLEGKIMLVCLTSVAKEKLKKKINLALRRF